MQKSRLTLNGLLALAATIAFQSCNPLSDESTSSTQQPQPACAPNVIGIRALRSACTEAGNTKATAPEAIATNQHFNIIVASDSSRLPDSIYVYSRGQVASAPRFVAISSGQGEVLGKIQAVFDQPLQVTDTVFVQAFRRPTRLVTLKCLNRNMSADTTITWDVVSVVRDSTLKVIGI